MRFSDWAGYLRGPSEPTTKLFNTTLYLGRYTLESCLYHIECIHFFTTHNWQNSIGNAKVTWYTSALPSGEPSAVDELRRDPFPRALTNPQPAPSYHPQTRHDFAMSSTNFAAAQERVLQRRRQREAEARARYAAQQRASPISPATVQRLPYPLNRLPGSGWRIWNSIKGREGTRPAFRVGQVDAELLDEELLGLLKGQVGDALKYFGVCLNEALGCCEKK